jgi:hypothetical protein
MQLPCNQAFTILSKKKWNSLESWLVLNYSVFHQFRQAKFAYLDFELQPIFATDPVGFKNDARYESGQN